MARLNIAPAASGNKLVATDLDTKATITFDALEITTEIANKPILWLGIYEASGTYVIGPGVTPLTPTPAPSPAP